MNMQIASTTRCPSAQVAQQNDPELQDFEAAIVCLYELAERGPHDESTLNIKRQAEDYCLQRKSCGETRWRYALDLLRYSDHQCVKFHALQLIQEFLAQGVDDQTAFTLRTSLIEWTKKYMECFAKESSFLKTKLAVVWALLIKRDYPDRWSSAFADWLTSVSLGRNYIELYLRVLLAIHEEVVESTIRKTNIDTAANMRVKDAMRESSCITETFQLFYRILSSSETAGPDTSLCAIALEAMKYHISWVDINLIVNDRFLPLLFQMARTNKELRCLVMNCIYEVVDKGMSHEKKLDLLSHIDILRFLRSLDIRDDEDFAEEVGEIVNSIGLQLLQCIEQFAAFADSEQYAVANAMVCELIPLVWELFSNENKSVSEEVFEFVNAVGTLIEGYDGKDAHAHQQPNTQDVIFKPSLYIPQILYGIYRQTKYTEDIVTDIAEFEDYRKNLYRIYINIIRKRPNDVLSFLSKLIEQLPMQFEQVDETELESILFMIFRFREGVVVAKDVQALEEPNSVFTAIVIRVHTGLLSTISRGYVFSPGVLMTYYDFAVRYTRCLQYQSNFIPMLLSMIFGSSGLDNPHGNIRSRVCYQCVRLVKSLGDYIIPHVPTILQALYPRLVIDPEIQSQNKKNPLYLTYEDQLNLYEVAGNVIAALRWTTEDKSDESLLQIRLQYSQTLLNPLLTSIKETAHATSSASLQKALGEQEDYMSRMLNATAHFLKAFKNSTCLSQEKELAGQVLMTCTELLHVPRMTMQHIVRSKIICVLHRIVSIMDPEKFLLSGLEALDRLMFSCDGQDVVEVIQLLNQLIIKYKSTFKPLMQSRAIPFIHHVCTLIPGNTTSQTTNVVSHVKDNEQLEREMMQKYLFMFLLHLIMHGLDDVLYHDINQSQLEAVFTLVLDGCVYVSDAAVKRTCFTIIHKVGLRWLDATIVPPEIKNWYSQWLVERASICIFQSGQQPDFNVDDAQYAAIIKEMAALLQCLIQKLGQEYLTLLQHLMLSANMPPEQVNSFCTQLCASDVAKVELLKRMFQRMKQKAP